MVNINKDYGRIFNLLVKSILISLAGIVFPISYLFLPAIFITESLIDGIIKIMFIFIVSCGIVAMASDLLIGMFIFGIFAPMILIFHYMILKKKDVISVLLFSTSVLFISILFNCYSYGINAEYLNSQATLNNFINIQKSIIDSGSYSTLLDEATLTVLYNKFLQILPGLLVVGSLVTSYITYLIVGRSLLKKGRFIPQPSSFRFLRLPSGLTYMISLLFILAIIIKAFVGDFSSVIVDNLLILFGSILFVLGLSVITFFLSRIKLGSVFKGICIFILLSIPGSWILLIVVALLDIIFNLRRLP